MNSLRYSFSRMKPAEMPWRTSSAAAWARHSSYADSADAPLSPRLVGISVPPEPRAGIGQGVTTAVPEHVRMDRERHLGPHPIRANRAWNALGVIGPPR
jgi:hypothetical protein